MCSGHCSETVFKTMLHNRHYRQRKNKQKSSPSALSDADVPRPVSPLSDVPGRRPKRLWNFSDTAGVCHSMSANRANAHLWKGTMTAEQNINTCGNDAGLMHGDSSVSTYPLVWIQYISARWSFHKRPVTCGDKELALLYGTGHWTGDQTHGIALNWNMCKFVYFASLKQTAEQLTIYFKQ